MTWTSAFGRACAVLLRTIVRWLALTRINPTFREVVVLRDTMDLSYDEISEVLQLSLGTVKSRILRGREALREALVGQLEPQRGLQLIAKTAE